MKIDTIKSAAAEKNQVTQEAPESRIRRLYAAQGGPLIGWLYDEARIRNQDLKQMSKELNVTFGYINQLRTGHRSTVSLSQKMTNSCARYLGVPPIVVKLLAGVISMSDFLFANETEEQLVERAIRKVQSDPQIRKSVPENLSELPMDAKKAIVAMYGEVSGHDLFNVRRLPALLNGLQRAAVIHDENEYIAINDLGNLLSYAE